MDERSSFANVIDTRGTSCNHFAVTNRDEGGVVSRSSGCCVPAVRSQLTGRNSEGPQGGRSVRKLIVCGVGLVAALALTVPGAFGGAAQTPGVTSRTVTIGGLFPLRVSGYLRADPE